MYRCGECNHVVRAGQTMLKKIVTTPVVYPFREKVNRTWYGVVKDDPGGQGSQIVKEIPLCFRCDADIREAAAEER